MSLSQSLTNCFSDVVGSGGIARELFAEFLEATTPAIAMLAERKNDGSLPMLELPYRTDDLAEIHAVADDIRARFKDLVVLGTGGSSLGGQTLVAMKRNPFLREEQPRVHFVDNVDAHTIHQMLSTLSLRDTAFLIISKSGGTAETVAQFLVVLDALITQVGEDAPSRQCHILTIPEENPLLRLARKHHIPHIEHDPKVGGRFSVLSNVGLIPAAVAGLDIKALRMGARFVMDNTLIRQVPEQNFAAAGAAVHCALIAAGKRVSVLMPYADRLACFGLWYKQLWAESIGKEGQGSTPVRAVGSIDQHSQLQLFLDGPQDKFVTMITLASQQPGLPLTHIPPKETSLDYLRNKEVGDLMIALQTGTLQSLVRNQVPVRHIEIPHLDEFTLGALLMHFMLETIISAHLLDIDAFDQPAVEQGKIIAREYLMDMPSKQKAVG